MKLLVSYLEELGPQIEEAAHQTLLEAGRVGQEAAKDTNLFRNNGPLREATNFHVTDQYSGFVLADKSYAQYLEDGNPAEGFIIRPVRAQALHFRINGHDVFSKTAKAHGPLPFMGNAERKVEEQIESIWDNNFNKAMEKL